MRQGQITWPDSEAERREMTRRCGMFAALGWIILNTFFELLFGPHVRLMRALAIGSGVGAVAGLLTSSLQWAVLGGYVREAGALIPVSTAGSALAGLMGGLLLYSLNEGVDLYTVNIPLQGALGAVFVCLVTTRVQWVVLRKWAVRGEGRGSWLWPTTAGSVLGAACSCLAWTTMTSVLGAMLGIRAWPYILLVAHFTAGMLGGTVYGVFVVRGLRQVLPAAMGGTDRPLRNDARDVPRPYSGEGRHSGRREAAGHSEK